MHSVILKGNFGPLCDQCVKTAARRLAQRNAKSIVIYGRSKSTLLHQNSSSYSRNEQSQRSIKRLFRVTSPCISKTFLPQIRFVHNVIPRSLTILNRTGQPVIFLCKRQVGTSGRVVLLVRKLVRIRNIVIAGAIGGGVALNEKYESLKDYIPDLEWMKEYLPESETFEAVKNSVLRTLRKIHLPEKGWLTNKLPSIKEYKDMVTNSQLTASEVTAEIKNSMPILGLGKSISEDNVKESGKGKKDEIQEEMLRIQMTYQKQIDKLEAENKDLRKQLLLKEVKTGKKPQWKRSLIDMYSDVLDELSGYDSSYNTQDNLPRVVVVGDQSSGKTSTLEMIAGARIFPRGSGKMMTKAPVKVTLSEGPYHVASFKDGSREFDLTKESDLSDLRREIELRMEASVKEEERTVSNKCISMNVKGPGIKRMVLVDLPGIISTETTGMASNTKESIKEMVNTYMANPNAIILCIQDGNLDAERSNVTDIVSQMDPEGKRTIFVLTKADKLEDNVKDTDRIKSILDGKLFPMKALAYFAVVTGKDNSSNDSIESIKEYEQNFFQRSTLVKKGVLKPTTTSTQNLSMAVSELFWNMVKESVEQQADAFKATRFNLETEWKNTFPRLRELDRTELFEKAKGEILDEIINLSEITAQEWENAFHKKIWEKISGYIFESIYLPAAQSQNSGAFKTTVDIRLDQWANGTLPKKCVEVGWDALHEEFLKIVERDKKKQDHDEIFDQFKLAVISEGKKKHQWESKAEKSLSLMQKTTLDDKTVPGREQWDVGVKFMEETLKEKLQQNEEKIKELTGPGFTEQWLSWKYQTEQHKQRGKAKTEVEKILLLEPNHRSSLAPDELTTVKKNLQTQGVEVDHEFIRETWHHIYRHHFLKKSLVQAQACKGKGFYHYKEGFSVNELDCSDVVLFWRLYRMLQVSSNALRQQVVNTEARRLERIIKEVLEEFGDNRDTLRKLLTGKRVELAEELKTVRQIQDKLEEFVQALNKEK